jgi:hypothetical protein
LAVATLTCSSGRLLSDRLYSTVAQRTLLGASGVGCIANFLCLAVLRSCNGALDIYALGIYAPDI